MICFAFHDSKLLIETMEEARESKKMVSALRCPMHPSGGRARVSLLLRLLSPVEKEAASLLERVRHLDPSQSPLTVACRSQCFSLTDGRSSDDILSTAGGPQCDSAATDVSPTLG